MSEPTKISRAGLTGAFLALWQPMVFVAALLVMIWAFFSTHDDPGTFGFDFRGTLWDAAKALRTGASPYPAVDSAAMESGNPALYPPFAIALVVPLTWLPWTPAVVVWATLLVLGSAAGIYLLGVRDWRCYFVFFASLPALLGILWGNLTLLLLLGVGVTWHWRDRAFAVGAAVGALIAAKLFLWPLLVWLVLTRRYKAAGWATGLTVVFIVVPWALIGFEGLRDYPALLNRATEFYGPRTSSLLSVGLGVGAPFSIAKVLPAVGAALLLGLAAVASRRPDGDVVRSRSPCSPRSSRRRSSGTTTSRSSSRRWPFCDLDSAGSG